MQQQASAFTLLEILLAMALGMVLMSMGYLVDIQMVNNTALMSASENLRRELSLARSYAINDTQDDAWGISVFPHEFVRFQGSTYASRDAVYDTVIALSPSITASSTGDVIFTRPEALPVSAQTITLQDAIRRRTIVINASGAISEY